MRTFGKNNTDEKTEDRDEKKSECHKKLGIKLKYLNLAHFFSCSILALLRVLFDPSIITDEKMGDRDEKKS